MRKSDTEKVYIITPEIGLGPWKHSSVDSIHLPGIRTSRLTMHTRDQPHGPGNCTRQFHQWLVNCISGVASAISDQPLTRVDQTLTHFGDSLNGKCNWTQKKSTRAEAMDQQFKHLSLFQRTWIWFKAPTWQLTTIWTGNGQTVDYRSILS